MRIIGLPDWCRGGSPGTAYRCDWIDTGRHEGYIDGGDPYGHGARTPLAAAFINCRVANGRKYAIWLRNSKVGKVIYKAVPRDEDPRDHANRSDHTHLQVATCEEERGRPACWDASGLVLVD